MYIYYYHRLHDSLLFTKHNNLHSKIISHRYSRFVNACLVKHKRDRAAKSARCLSLVSHLNMENLRQDTNKKLFSIRKRPQ